MENRPTSSLTRLAIAVVVGAVVLSAAAVSYSSFGRTTTSTTTSVSASISELLVTSITTSTLIVTEIVTMTPSATGTACIQLESAPLFLTVKNGSTGAPISSLPVQVGEAPLTDPCSETASTTINLGTMETNVNGSINVCCTGSTFFFRFTYEGVTYHVSELANGAESAECATFYVPSNTTTITYAGSFVYYC